MNILINFNIAKKKGGATLISFYCKVRDSHGVNLIWFTRPSHRAIAKSLQSALLGPVGAKGGKNYKLDGAGLMAVCNNLIHLYIFIQRKC